MEEVIGSIPIRSTKFPLFKSALSLTSATSDCSPILTNESKNRLHDDGFVILLRLSMGPRGKSAGSSRKSYCGSLAPSLAPFTAPRVVLFVFLQPFFVPRFVEW
jgi:hypothetical protein